MASEVVERQTWYLPTYLANKHDAGVTLLTKQYEIRRTPKGNVRLQVKTAAPDFPSVDEMVAAITDGGWRELPAEADGVPRYVPDEIAAAVERHRAAQSAAQPDPSPSAVREQEA